MRKDLPEPTPPALLAKKVAEDLSVGDDSGSGEPNILEDADDDEQRPGVLAEDGPRAPNFRGKTMRAVLAEAAAKGLNVLPDGSGVARMQAPPPGAVLHPGESIRVQFVR